MEGTKAVKKAKDKKVRALLATHQTLTDEANKRLHEEKDFFNTEQAGYLEIDEEEDGERARTLKINQKELKNLLGV